ncbi:winged helix-turn-helix domain-containing protein [Vibrio coralliilyticus]|uniref:winged helix-turn-helix domain-containing protein n=1 Tax=Vibrio coralliilyticus TaxID=190893 RepID=UPI000C16B69F|nr:winged helix-turn-helix domain-containing protein [Vibrio coralliilyticus]
MKILLLTQTSVDYSQDVIHRLTNLESFEVQVSYANSYSFTIPMLRGYDCIAIMRPLQAVIDLLESPHLPYFPSPLLWITDRLPEEESIPCPITGMLDWIMMPVTTLELKTRLTFILERWHHGVMAESRLVYGPLHLHVHDHTLRCQSVTVPLTASEFDLMAYLVLNVNRYASLDDIAVSIRHNQLVNHDAVRVLVCRLRRKMRTELGRSFIHTKRNIGYQLCLADDEKTPSDQDGGSLDITQ